MREIGRDAGRRGEEALSEQVMAAGGGHQRDHEKHWEEQDGSPELGSQGSMSSSSLGHSADATSRSSADCGEERRKKQQP